MQSIKFSLPIVPTSQARARVTVRGKFATAYKTGSQKANELALEVWLKDHQPKKPLEGPLVLEFVAALPCPLSVSKKKREAMLSGEEYPAKKPDLDNLAKQLKDAMTRMQFWRDDAQIVCMHCEKIYAEAGRWDVVVYEAIRRPA